MPPKRKAAEKGEEHLERENFDSELEITSPPSSGSSMSTASSLSTRSCGSLSAEQLEQILANNQKAMLEASKLSMTALLANLVCLVHQLLGCLRLKFPNGRTRKHHMSIL